jgi:protein-S-isoprenylcysteine O-methyltransferase Ste14
VKVETVDYEFQRGGNQMMRISSNDGRIGMIRICLLILAYFAFQAALLFGSAGTWDWPEAWVYLGIQVVIVAAVFVLGDRRMLEIRSKWESNAKRWDMVLAPLSSCLFWFVPLIIAGLDAGRFHWSTPLPKWVAPAAFTLHAVGLTIGICAMISNPFFAKAVAIMHDRGHHAVSGGPYAYVRHPGYSGALLAFGALPLALGSIWGLMPALLGLALLVVRTAWEDDTLLEELPGYTEYARRVRWRLIPYIW